MKFLAVAVSLVSFVGSQWVCASETDQYLAWGKELKDATQVINSYLNSKTNLVLEAVNKRPDSYSCTRVARKVGMYFAGGGYQARTRTWVEENEAIDVYPPRSVSGEDYFKASIFGDGKYMGIGRTLSVNNIHFGTDKFAHSISLGFVYYVFYLEKLARLDDLDPAIADQKATAHAIDFGVSTERGMLGSYTTGVFSYGDLEANYQGFQLFKSMCAGEHPRLQKVALSNGRAEWQLVRAIDFSDYVNPRWDETFNPSFISAKKWPQVSKRLAKYCGLRFSAAVDAQRQSYELRAEPSENSVHISHLLATGATPNTEDQSLATLCAESEER